MLGCGGGKMYNKCDKCGKLLNNFEDRRLILDNQNQVSTRCMPCYEELAQVKPTL